MSPAQKPSNRRFPLTRERRSNKWANACIGFQSRERMFQQRLSQPVLSTLVLSLTAMGLPKALHNTNYLSAASRKASRVRRFASRLRFRSIDSRVTSAELSTSGSDEPFSLDDHVGTGSQLSQFADDFRLAGRGRLFRFFDQHPGFLASGSQATDFALTFGTGHKLLFVVVKNEGRKRG